MICSLVGEIAKARASCLVLTISLEALVERLMGVAELEVIDLITGISAILKNIAADLEEVSTDLSDEVG